MIPHPYRRIYIEFLIHEKCLTCRNGILYIGWPDDWSPFCIGAYSEYKEIDDFYLKYAIVKE
jgi:hypothetical protein